jgi:hypothetical protein
MNKHYKLLKSEDKVYTYVSVSTDFSRPNDYLNKLEVELNDLGYEGKVAFDLLLSNGTKNNRFFSAYFDGKKIIGSTFSNITEVASSVSTLTTQFYKRNYDLVSVNHILSKSQKYLIKQGISR